MTGRPRTASTSSEASCGQRGSTTRGGGKISAEELKGIEDECIRDLVAKEKKAGLGVIADGEFRRETWHLDFM